MFDFVNSRGAYFEGSPYPTADRITTESVEYIGNW